MGEKNSKIMIPSGYDSTIREGNPNYGFRMQLYCRTGYHLVIYPDGRVRGLREDKNSYGIMDFSSAGIGEVRIKCEESKLYLAMNRKGLLYGERDPREDSTIFIENFAGQYNSYLSKKYAHLGWYIGIKKSGKPKQGPKTKWGQKATQFLPIRTDRSPDKVFSY